MTEDNENMIVDTYNVQWDGKDYQVRLSKTQKHGVGHVQDLGFITVISTGPDHYEKHLTLEVTSLEDAKRNKDTVRATLMIYPTQNGFEVGLDIEETANKNKGKELLDNFFINPLNDIKMPTGSNSVLQEYLITDFSVERLKKMANPTIESHYDDSHNSGSGHRKLTVDHMLANILNSKSRRI